MKRLLIGSLTLGVPVSSVAAYSHLKLKPQDRRPAYDEKMKTIDPQKKQKIVVIGAGMAGINASYFLSDEERNEVILIDRNKEVSKEASYHNGGIFVYSSAATLTSRPLSQMIKGFYSSEVQECFYVSKLISEPGLLRFTYYYLNQADASNNSSAKSSGAFQPLNFKDSYKDACHKLKLLEMSRKLRDQMIQDNKIDPDSINLDTEQKLYYFNDLPQNMTFEQFCKKQEKLTEMQDSEHFMGTERLVKELGDKLATQCLKHGKFDFVTKMNHTHSMDWYLFNLAIYSVLQKRDNFKAVLGESIKSFKLSHDNTVIGVETDSHQNIECDKVVVCTGGQTNKFLYDILGVSCPIMGVKGYACDLESVRQNPDEELPQAHQMFIGETQSNRLCIVPLGKDNLRISTLVDLAGHDLKPDKAREDYFRKIVQSFAYCGQHKTKIKNVTCCLRPVPPDDLPFVGNLSQYPNVYLNTGHSARGTISVATSKMVSDMVTQGKQDYFKPNPFEPQRYLL